MKTYHALNSISEETAHELSKAMNELRMKNEESIEGLKSLSMNVFHRLLLNYTLKASKLLLKASKASKLTRWYWIRKYDKEINIMRQIVEIEVECEWLVFHNTPIPNISIEGFKDGNYKEPPVNRKSFFIDTDNTGV
jgi:hypothetical protein